jgi:uncharacterized DUF497 family protein
LPNSPAAKIWRPLLPRDDPFAVAVFDFRHSSVRWYNCRVSRDYLRILWDAPDDPDGNVQHVAEHGLDLEDVEEVLENPTGRGRSESTQRPCVWGYTREGVYIIVVYDEIDEDTIRVVTAYEVPESN